MTQLEDRFANTVSVVYKNSTTDTVWKVKDPLDTATVLTYGTYGLSSIQAKGRTTTITVDASRRLTVFKDPDNDSTRFGYDGSSRLSTITNRGGHVYTLTYDDWGRLATDSAPSISVVEPNGSTTTARPTTVYEAWQRSGVPSPALHIDSVARPAVLTDSAWAKVTEPGGAYTRFTVNRWGVPKRIRTPYGGEVTTTFDSRGLPTLITAVTGDTTTMVYDTLRGLPTYMRSAPDSGIYTRYAGWGQPDSMWGPSRPITRNVIGSNGRISSSWFGNGSTTYHYDSRGRVDSLLDPLGYLEKKTWFSSTNGNPTKDSMPGGRVTEYLYDSFGRDTAVKSPGGPWRRVQYDAVNRPTHVYSGAYSLPPTITYYSALSVDSVKDAKGQKYAFAHNALGWLIRKVDAIGVAETLGYSRDGELRRWVNRRNEVATFEYDSLHRLTSKSGTNTPAVSWAYSSFGKVIAAVDSFSTDSTFLGMQGRPQSIKTLLGGYSYTRQYKYYVNGLLDSVAVSGTGSASFTSRKYAYDNDKYQLQSIKLGAVPATTMLTNEEMYVTRAKLPGGDSTYRSFTPVNKLAQQYNTGAYSATVNRFVNYDLASRISRQVIGDGIHGTDFAYDSLGRLVSVGSVQYQSGGNPCTPPNIIDENGNQCTYEGTWSTTSTTTFSYDSVGNRRDLTGTYGIGNRIQQFDSCAYSTDSLGNVTRRSCGAPDSVWFSWTAESRLKKVRVFGGDSLQFDYDANGRLLRKKRNGSVDRLYLWDGPNLHAELNASGALKGEYCYYPALDSLHALISGSSQYFAHSDALGNVVALTDTFKNVKRTYEYSAWGALVGGSDDASLNNADLARFKGAIWQGPDVDLYYMRNRWYEAKTGRFLSEDPAGIQSSPNLYGFVSNDPINRKDPMGLEECPQGFKPVGIAKITIGEKSADFVECKGPGGVTKLIPASSYTGPQFTAGGPGYPPHLSGALSALQQGIQSCRSVTYRGDAGYVSVQTHTNGTVAWGIYMHNPADNYGPWYWFVSIDGKKHASAAQLYPPHHSILRKDAPSGSILSILAVHVTLFSGGISFAPPNACVVP